MTKPQGRNFKHMAGAIVQTPIQATEAMVGDTMELMASDGPISPRSGLGSGVLCLALALLCLLGALAFHFPAYLTTPELRREYDVGLLRQIMFGALLLSGTVTLINVIYNRARAVNGFALLIVLGTVALGGSRIPVGDFADNTPYLGLDWFILDLLGSTLIFAALERMFPLYKNQVLFRKHWQNDLTHFGFNHLLIGFMLLVVNYAIHHVFGWMVKEQWQAWIQNLSFVPQLLLCIFLADLVEYWTHRAYHEVPFLWRFHAVHHSTETLDWLAGSRLHFMEIIVTRVMILGALYVAGFSKGVLDAYILVVGFQAVFNHANIHINWGPIRHLIVTPDFHHWHHSSDDEAIDRNYAAHFSFIDRIFGTAVDSEKTFPENYGVVGNYVPDGFVKQQLFPFVFRASKEDTDA